MSKYTQKTYVNLCNLCPTHLSLTLYPLQDAVKGVGEGGGGGGMDKWGEDEQRGEIERVERQRGMRKIEKGG